MYAVQKAEKSADIYIYGDLVPNVWFEGETSAKSLVDEIKGLGDVEAINLHIDSYGGSVSEGWAIYNALRQTNAKIRTYGDGFVASAALFPFLAGDERIASPVSAYFLHDVLTCAEGNAKDLRKAADEVEKMTEIGINAFVERAGMDADTVQKLMDNETWLSGEDALVYGIATEIANEDKSKYAQSAKSVIMQKIFGDKIENKPEESIDPEEKIDDEPIEEIKPEEDAEPISIFNKFKNSIQKGK